MNPSLIDDPETGPLVVKDLTGPCSPSGLSWEALVKCADRLKRIIPPTQYVKLPDDKEIVVQRYVEQIVDPGIAERFYNDGGTPSAVTIRTGLSPAIRVVRIIETAARRQGLRIVNLNLTYRDFALCRGPYGVRVYVCDIKVLAPLGH